LNDASEGKEGADLLLFSPGMRSPRIINAGEHLEFPDNPEEGGNAYRLRHLKVDDLDRDGFQEIILATWHRHRYSAQIYVFDTGGNILMRYTNAGAIYVVDTMDIDGDGVKEVIGAGTDNYPDCNRAMVVGFSPFDQTMLPPGTWDHPRIYNRHIELARVKFFVTFDQTPLGKKFWTRNFVSGIEYKERSNRLLVMVSETESWLHELYYTLSLPDCRVLNVETGDPFEENMKIHFPDVTVNESFKTSLKDNVRVWYLGPVNPVMRFKS